MELKYNSYTATDLKLCLSLFQLNTNVFINCKIPILKPKSPPNTPIIPLSFPRKTDLLEKQVKILEFLHDSKPYKINWYVISPWLKSVISISLYIVIYHMGPEHESREKKFTMVNFLIFVQKNVSTIRFQEIKIRP